MPSQPNLARHAGEVNEHLVYVGDTAPVPIAIEVIHYDEHTFEEQTLTELRECPYLHDGHTVTWVNVTGLSRVEVFEQLGQCFGLHPLVLEDMLDTNQRPKVEDYDDYLYMVVKHLEYGQETEVIGADQVSLVLGPQFVVSVQERPGTRSTPSASGCAPARGACASSAPTTWPTPCSTRSWIATFSLSSA